MYQEKKNHARRSNQRAKIIDMKNEALTSYPISRRLLQHHGRSKEGHKCDEAAGDDSVTVVGAAASLESLREGVAPRSRV